MARPSAAHWAPASDDHVFNVRDYGAVGNGSTDDTAAIQATVDAMSTGDWLFFPIGTYKLTAAILFGQLRALRITGGGGQNANAGGSPAATIRLDTDAQVGFDFNNGGAAQIHEGPIIEYLNFEDNTTAKNATAISIDAMNYWTVRNCTFRPKVFSSTGGTGILIDNSNKDNSWSMIEQCRFLSLDIGVDVQGGFGCHVAGGNFLSKANQIGVYLGPNVAHWNLFGTKFDGPIDDNSVTGIKIDGGAGNGVFACSFEAVGVGVDILNGTETWHGDRNRVVASDFAEGSSTETLIGVRVEADCRKTVVTSNTFTEIDTPISNASTSAIIRDNAGTPEADGPADNTASEVATATTLDWSQNILNVDTSGATRVVTLPDNAKYAGKSYTIHRDGSNVLTLVCAGSDTFDDTDTSKDFDTDGATMTFCSIGDTEWKVLATQGTITET